MARIVKNGLGYVRLDCDFFDKEKTFLIEERFGEIGTLYALRLMMWLYQTEGCYMAWSDGSAYYFAKKILNKADAADMVENLVSFLVEIGFFDAIQAEENGKKVTYLSSEEIVEDWLKTITYARLKVNLERIPQIVINTYATQFYNCAYFTKVTQINAENLNSTFNALNSTFKPLNSTFKAINASEKRGEESTKQINNKAKNNFAFIAENAGESRAEKPPAENEKPPFSAWIALAVQTEPPAVFAAAREAVLNTVYFRGIARGLVDAAARCVSAGWITERGLCNIRRKADAAVELYRDTQGRRGNENGWEVVRDCIALVIRENGYTPPEYSRLDPEPPPAKPAKAERVAAGV